MVQTCVIIDKYGKYSTKQFRDITEVNLYKKCGFSNNSHFQLIYTFKVKERNLHLYGKTDGRANTVNKFELPPPLDNTLYYGSIMVLSTIEETISFDALLPYTKENWTTDYEYLMGGFEDIDHTDDETETDEMNEYSDSEKTKEGYLKDGFIVDEPSPTNNSGNTETDDSSEYEDSELDEEEYQTESDED